MYTYSIELIKGKEQLTVWCKDSLQDIIGLLRYLKQINVNCFIELKHNPMNAECIFKITELSDSYVYKKSRSNRQIIIYNNNLHKSICDLCINRFVSILHSCNCRKFKLIEGRDNQFPFYSLTVLIGLDDKFINDI